MRSCKPSNILADLLPGLDGIYGLRDDLGLTFKQVSIITRTWPGRRLGDGKAVDRVEPMRPTPQITEIGNDIRIQEAGAVKQGDVILKGVSKHSYPTIEDVQGLRQGKDSPLVETFYLLGDAVYTLVNVKERYVTWDLLLRRRSDQTRY